MMNQVAPVAGTGDENRSFVFFRRSVYVISILMVVMSIFYVVLFGSRQEQRRIREKAEDQAEAETRRLIVSITPSASAKMIQHIISSCLTISLAVLLISYKNKITQPKKN